MQSTPAESRRARLVGVALTYGGGLFLLFDVTAAVPLMTHAYVDFPLWFAAATVTRTLGLAHAYDPALMGQVTAALAGHPYPNAFISPPPLAWLALPFSLLPYPAAFAAWVAALAAAMLGAWWLGAPGAGWPRLAALAVPASLFPVAFSMMIGAVPALGVLVVVLAWRCLAAGRPYLAGVVLSLLAIKPQLGLLVAPALLVAGHWRVFATWCAGSALLAAASLLALGSSGLDAELRALQTASGWAISQRFTVAAVVGAGWSKPLQVALGLAALTAAWRNRASGVELPIAAGILGSLLASPYLSLQDYAMLVPAAWLVWRAPAPAWLRWLVAAGAIPLELAQVWGPVPILLFDLVWLAALLALPYLVESERRPAIAPVAARQGAMRS